jgi:hypothetical protein
METTLDTGKVRQLAKALDDAIEKHAIEELVSYFSVECEIQLPGIILNGYAGLRKAIDWMYSFLGEITLIPITIIIQDNVFFEEFLMKAKIRGDEEIQAKQAEVLVYDNDYKVTSLRLYFDRLELGKAFSTNAIDRLIINKLIRASLKDLQ